MEKTVLLKKLQVILDDAERANMFGTVEVEIRHGRPTLIRKITTEKLDESTGNGTHANDSKNRY